jgi:phage N-6-adenine-methyltransferase
MTAINSKTPVNEKDEWRTPPELFKWAYDQWGPFDIDLAANYCNGLLDQIFVLEDNAFIRDWNEHGFRGWLNPPYSDVKPWMQKAWDESRKGFTTVMLVPTYNGGQYWFDLVIGRAAEIYNIEGRISFLRPDGTIAKGNSLGSCFLVYRPGWIPQQPAVQWVTRKEIFGE